ncbi:MAG: hypothetical protein LQ346_002972 [Caloplaca aetnensis]|nr:MAG: hypothetical protein LQ346_002972 [Caloplaca aetnensis]
MHLPFEFLATLVCCVPPVLSAPASSHDSASRLPSHLGRRGSAFGQTPHVIELTRSSVTTPRSRYAKSLQTADPGNETIGIATLNKYKDVSYLTNLTVGTQTLLVNVDTGSADTWLVETEYDCVSPTGLTTLPRSSCGLGPSYTRTSTFEQIQGQNFKISYGDGEFVSGLMGEEAITLGGITVKDQHFGLVNTANWRGDKISSGLLGLSFANNTRAYNGTNPRFDGEYNRVAYNPLFTNMYTQGLVAPVFSLAINRGKGAGGLLALGGLPPVQHSPTFACTPFQVRTRAGLPTVNTGVYQYYDIKVDGISYGNTTETLKPLADVDSGTSLILLDPFLAERVNQQFDPPAYFNKATGEYTVDCAAKSPRFGVVISNHTFYVNPKDMIVEHEDGTCITGVTKSSMFSASVLGGVFLKNVLAVFDVGASVMRFAARENY